MSRATRQPASVITNTNPDLSSTDVIIGGTQRLQYLGQTNTNQNYRVVYVPSTRETMVVLQTFNSLGAANALDANQRIATLGPNNRWIPSEYADTLGGQSLIDAINRNGTTANNFTQSTRIAINQDSIDRSGKSLTSQQMSAAQTTPNSSASSITQNATVTGSSGTSSQQQQQQQSNSSQPDGATPPGAAPGDTDLITTVRETTTAFTQVNTTLNTISELATVNAIGLKPSKETLQYPLEFPTNMDCIKFSAKRYGTKTFSGLRVTGNANDPSNRSRLNEETKDYVILPIQTGISDANTVGWNEETFNPAQIAGAQLAIGGISGGGEGFANSLNQILNGMKSANTDMEKAIIAYFTEQAVGVQILPKIGGAVFNPNTELLFQGPQLRSFNFSFRLTPREEKESLVVKKIIRFFKSNMAAQTTKSELFLKAPNVFGIEFFHGGSTNPHSGIGLIRDCALQACNVDYTPDGSYMSFFDGGMVSYTINLQFMELEPIYADDYNKSNHPIGY